MRHIKPWPVQLTWQCTRMTVHAADQTATSPTSSALLCHRSGSGLNGWRAPVLEGGQQQLPGCAVAGHEEGVLLVPGGGGCRRQHLVCEEGLSRAARRHVGHRHLQHGVMLHGVLQELALRLPVTSSRPWVPVLVMPTCSVSDKTCLMHGCVWESLDAVLLAIFDNAQYCPGSLQSFCNALSRASYRLSCSDRHSAAAQLLLALLALLQ